MEGPVQVMLTTTAAEIDEELQNRCIVLSVNEDRAQTRAIHEVQRKGETLAGLLGRRSASAVATLHQNAQRLLRSVKVVNPYAMRLTFRDTRLRMRRDHAKYLALIRAVAFLHQFQRETKVARDGGKEIFYIDATLADIETAHRLAHEILGRSLDDLAPSSRRLLAQLRDMTDARCRASGKPREDIRFTRREAREATGWSETTLRGHLDRLVAMEYLHAHRGGPGRQYAYEMVYQGEGTDGAPFLLGLVDVKSLRPGEEIPGCDETSRGLACTSQAVRAGFAPASLRDNIDATALAAGELREK